MVRALVAVICAAMLSAAAGCDESQSGVSPTPQPSPAPTPAPAPTPTPGITVSQLFPASGATLTVTGTPPGTFLERGSGKISVGLNITAPREMPFARLNVYLLRDGGYCGQNLPDWPAWSPFPVNSTTSVAITGFQVFGLPCTVTGIRAMLNWRTGGLLTPPTPDETVLDVTIPVSYRIVR
jgi:hypothetical protein